MRRRGTLGGPHWVAAVLALTAGAAFYATGRAEPVSDVFSGAEIVIGSLPSFLHGVLVGAGMAWAAGAASRVLIVTAGGLMVTAIEMSQSLGPFAGWGTTDGADVAAGIIGVVGIALSRRARQSPHPRRRHARVLVVALLAATTGAASAGPILNPDEPLDVVMDDPVVNRINDESASIAVLAQSSDGPADTFEIRATSTDPVTIEPATCFDVDIDTARCRFVVLRTDPAISGARVELLACADKEVSNPGCAGRTVRVNFGTIETTVPRAPCSLLNPSEISYGPGTALSDAVLLSTADEAGHDFAGRTLTIRTTGSGTHLVVLALEPAIHDPCDRGPIEELTYTLIAQGAPENRGNVAVRPAVIVAGDTYFAEPLTVRDGGSVDETVTLTSSDLTSLSGANPDLVSGPPVMFGVLVGISCPATSTCGAVERTVTIGHLSVIVNPATE